MKIVEFVAALLILLLVCSNAGSQVPAQPDLYEELPLIQQEAIITTLDDQGVVLEMRDGEGASWTVVLSGPEVVVYSKPGEVFLIDDLNSPSVGGVLGEDEVTFLGNLMLTTAKKDAPTPRPGGLRVHVSNGVVEIRTQEAEDRTQTNRSADQIERPLNQQAWYIKSEKERVKGRREM